MATSNHTARIPSRTRACGSAKKASSPSVNRSAESFSLFRFFGLLLNSRLFQQRSGGVLHDA